ncbi:MAG: hypothetical protein TEF_16745 [Rhizobiales bacterium NRL2]|nr:MAG: hypothetical protein TEF_16745 [Rhizobiales bacterium NRL2]
MAMAWETLLYEPAGRVGTITINRPDQLNALNSTVFREMSELLAEVAVDPAIRVIVLKGAGNKAFVAGADIKEMVGMSRREAETRSWTGMRLYDQMRRMPQPLVASIQGYALGGGMLIAMACDIRVASTAASFGYPEIRLGIFPGTGGTVLIDRLIGPATARAICLLGDRFSAERAFQLGLVNRLAEPDDLEKETAEVVETLANYSPVAMRELKTVLNASLEMDFATAREFELDAYGRCFDSEDRREGTRAFVEKRKPDFRGR